MVLKGIVHPKMKNQTRKTSEHKLRYFWYFIFLMNSELSDPPIDSKCPYMIKAQKRSKNTIKIIHVTSAVQP